MVRFAAQMGRTSLAMLAAAAPLAWLAPASAQQPAAAPARQSVGRTDDGVWSFPFELSAGKIFLEVTVNGRGPYPFVMDTGSPATIIDSDLAEELGLRVTPMGQVGGAGEGSAKMFGVNDVRLEFGGIDLGSNPMMGVNINATISGYSGREVRGLIGNDFIWSHLVEIDYGGRTVTVRDPKKWAYSGDGAIIPARRRGHTFISGQVVPEGGEPIKARFLVDTGAGLTVSLTSPFVTKHDLVDLAAPPIEATVGFGLGGEVRHPVCRLDRITVGGVEVSRPWASLSDDRAGAAASRDFDAILGGEILSRYTVIFDGPRGRMILEPAAGSGRPFDFDMSGLAISGDGQGGRLRIMRVEDDSPASTAGIKPGDLILSIDGREYTAKDRDTVRAKLKGENQKRTLRLLRDGEDIEITMRLKRQV
jgi:predicted aspartyl protease